MNPLLIAKIATILFAAAAVAQDGTVGPRDNSALVRMARQIEPSGTGQAEKLSAYVDFFRLKLGNDTRLFAFDVTASLAEDGAVRLEGFVEFPETRNGIEKFLNALGFADVDNQLETLPTDALGETKFGLVKVTNSLIYDSSTQPQDVVTDCLLGERLYLLREQDDHLLVHSQEGYVGYIAAADVRRVDAARFAEYPGQQRVRVVADHQLESNMRVPAGAVLQRLRDNGDHVQCALPGGETLQLPAAKCEAVENGNPAVERLIASGEAFAGTPYLWGGKTTRGVDCSGLVQVAFSTVGVRLPRDANQQFLAGQLSATRWHRSELRRGDTLFFIGPLGKIRHTAIYLGDDRYLHAVVPHVRVDSFDREHDDYQPRRDSSFAFAKRVVE